MKILAQEKCGGDWDHLATHYVRVSLAVIRSVLHPLTLSSPVRPHTVFAGVFLYLLRQMRAHLLAVLPFHSAEILL